MHDLVDRHLLRLQLERRLARNTLAAYGSDLARHIAWLHERAIASAGDVTPQHLREYLAELHEAGLAPRSRVRARATLRGFYSFLVQEGVLRSDPAREIEAPRLRRELPRSLREDDLERLLAAAGGTASSDRRDRALLELAYGAGLRVSELVALRSDQLDLEDRWVRVIGKGSKERILPLGRQAVGALRSYLATARGEFLGKRTDDGILFRNARGGPLSRMGFWRILRRRGTRGGLDVSQLHPHLLRHTYATHLVERGASLRVVQELLGHAQVKTTEIYTAVDRDRLRQVHETCHPRGG